MFADDRAEVVDADISPGFRIVNSNVWQWGHFWGTEFDESAPWSFALSPDDVLDIAKSTTEPVFLPESVERHPLAAMEAALMNLKSQFLSYDALWHDDRVCVIKRERRGCMEPTP